MDAVTGLCSAEDWLERRGVCSGIYRTFEPTCNTTPQTEGNSGSAPDMAPFTVACPHLKNNTIIKCLPALRLKIRSIVKWQHGTKILILLPAPSCECTSQTVCDAQLDHRGHWCDMWKTAAEKRVKREGWREEEGAEERCNEARLQGWTQSHSLSPFFQYPLLMKFHLDCKCSVIYHHKCVMGPWIQWHCAG